MKTFNAKTQKTQSAQRIFKSGFSLRNSAPLRLCVKNKNSGIALVLTLILLSVTLIMAVAFLFLSRREQGSLTTQTDSTTARYAADSALAAAQAQIAANILAGPTPNPYNYGLLVSTNYINPFGFLPNSSSFTNVNYYDVNGNFLTGNNFLQNLANLFYAPRPPVFIQTNGTAGGYDFRFYLDLNRNGRFEPNGYSITYYTNSSGILVSNDVTSFLTGDPEWIGVLERPDLPYGPNNHFVARYAYIAIPVGNTLDLNAIHNQVFEEGDQSSITVNPYQNSSANYGKDYYFRNQGVGTYEINLAAFLADLNTNAWDNNSSGGMYEYNWPGFNSPSIGAAFDDARALLAYRYDNNYASLAPADMLFQSRWNYPSNVDVYADGGLQMTINTNYFMTVPFPLSDNLGLPFAGADNTNHFFDLASDLFDLSKTARGVSPADINAGRDFTARLLNTGTGGSTYDRYTYYRMLSQLGTDSEPESGKINLNYSNAVVLTNANGTYAGFTVIPGAETNLTPWQPIQFFSIAADSLLRTYTAQWAANYGTNQFGIVTNGAVYGAPNTNFVAMFNVTAPFGITDIPVWVSNRFVYTPAVNRLLQLAANIYDATQTNFYPTIFRPMFSVTNQNGNDNVFITGYTEMTQTNFAEGQETSTTFPELAAPVEVTALPIGQNILTNVYGVPWIIGAKKGFPNFNEFVMANAFGLVRKLEFIRDTNTSPPRITQTNQMYLLSLTNYYGIELWNSYRSNYLGHGIANPGAVDIFYRCTSFIALTNDDYFYLNNSGYTTNYGFTNVAYFAGGANNSWLGWNGKDNNGSIVVPLNIGVSLFTNAAAYAYNDPHPANYSQFTYNTNYWDTNGIQNLPRFGLLTTNRLQLAIIDFSAGPNNGRVIDYVQLGGMDDAFNPNSLLNENGKGNLDYWSTNLFNGDTMTNLGVFNQIQTSEGLNPASGWATPSDPNYSKDKDQADFFRGFMSGKSVYYAANGFYSNYENNVQAPYTPSIVCYESMSWQANDPLVHYLASDLGIQRNISTTVTWPNTKPDDLGVVNTRYMPWGAAWPQQVGQVNVDTNAYNLAYKDPLVWWSDNWDFPANKLPSVGWLGRVHRGTPWQTVYLKSKDILPEFQIISSRTNFVGTNTWVAWTGNAIQAPNGTYFDAVNESPTQDRLLFDLFTTSLNDNATRGQLSVNVGANNVGDSQAGLAAWSALFGGVTVLSNNLPDKVAGLPNNRQGQTAVPTWDLSPSYSFTSFQPAGPLGTNSPLGEITAGINNTRATFMNSDGLVGGFEHKGDILATPQLTDISPYLKTYTNYNGKLVGDTVQLNNGISDEMYEWLPQQVMSLLKGGNQPARYVIYCWGQSLQPAPGGIYLNNDNFFGMVTNYQVTAETATRAVVRVTPTNAVIESFNLLPPD